MADPRQVDLGIVTAYGLARAAGYSGTKQQFAELLANAANYAEFSDNRAKDSEAYALGTREGRDVEPDDPTYLNNAKHYAEMADNDASDAEAYGAGTRSGEDLETTDPAYHNNARYYADEAEKSVNKGGYLNVELRDGKLYALYVNMDTIELIMRNGGLYVVYG